MSRLSSQTSIEPYFVIGVVNVLSNIAIFFRAKLSILGNFRLHQSKSSNFDHPKIGKMNNKVFFCFLNEPVARMSRLSSQTSIAPYFVIGVVNVLSNIAIFFQAKLSILGNFPLHQSKSSNLDHPKTANVDQIGASG